MGWLTGWIHRKSVTIAGSSVGAQTDYQMRDLFLHSGEGTEAPGHGYLDNHGALDNFQDIRITKEDGATELDFWLESMERHFAKNGVSQPQHPIITGPSAFYYNGKTYCVWQGTNLHPYINCYTHATGLWATPVKVGTNPLSNDDHGVPVVTVDNSGYIHIAFGCHASSMEYVKSTNPEDITAWTVKTDLSADASYPYWIKDSGGNLYIFYRGPASTYKVSYQKSTDGGANWSAETTIIDGTDSTYQIYKGNCEYDAVNGKIHIGWCNYTSGTLERRNIFYAYLNLSDGKMYSMAGDDLGATITDAEMDSYCKAVNSGTDQVNIPALRVDSNGYPHLIYNQDISGNYEYFHVRWNGTAWESPVEITNCGNLFNHPDFIFSGTNIIALLTVAEDGIRGGDIQKWVWNGSTWSKSKDVLTRAQIRFDGSNYSLNNPQFVKDGVSALLYTFAEVPIEGYEDYGFDDKRVYVFNSDDKSVGLYGVGDVGRFVVEVDTIPADPATVDIYVYYGNAGASLASSIQNTMIKGDDGVGGNMTSSVAGSATLSRAAQGKYLITEDSVDDAFAVGHILGGWNKLSRIEEFFVFSGGSNHNVLLALFDTAVVSDVIGTNAAKSGLRRFFIGRYVTEGVFHDQVVIAYVDVSNTWHFWTGSGWTTTTTRHNIKGKIEFKIWDNGATLYADILYNGISIFASSASIAISSVKAFSNGICLVWNEFYTDYYNVVGNVKNFYTAKYVSPEPAWGAWGSEEAALPSGMSFVAWIN